MTDPDGIERSLALARDGSWSPAGARARVRAKLNAANAPANGEMQRQPSEPQPSEPQPSEPQPSATDAERGVPRATPATQGSVTKLTASVLMGLGFLAGYWLGVQRISEPASSLEPSSAAAPSAAASPPAAGEPPPTGPAASAPSDVAPDRLPSAEAPAAHGTSAPPAHPQQHGAEPPASSASPRAHHGRASRAAAPPASSSDTFGDEVALLQRAERAIRGNDAALALAFLNDLDRLYPSSTLNEERSAARVLAECALSAPESRRRGELFLRDRGASVYADRVRRLCRLDGSGTREP